MFGTREEFTYQYCAACDSLAILTVPENLHEYYAQGYYSFSDDPSEKNRLKRFAHRARARHVAINERGIAGGIVAGLYPDPLLESLALLSLHRSMSILDVGCGTGKMIHALADIGFMNVVGADPFIANDRRYPNGALVLKLPLFEIEGSYDVVMFHHSFEHMDEPWKVLDAASRLLKPGGTCLVNTPNLRSHAWEHYGVDWVQLDAPRHLFIHSAASITALAHRSGLAVGEVACNATDFQFWGSEQYRHAISLTDARSHAVNPSASMFSRKQIAAWKRQSRELNTQGRGDQIAVYMKKV